MQRRHFVRKTLAAMATASLAALFVSSASAQTQEDIKVTLNPFSQPAYHSGGDTDFGGHGPAFTGSVTLKVINETTLVLIVDGVFTETQSDWTKYEVHSRTTLLDLTAEKGPGWKISTVRGRLDVPLDNQVLSGYGTHRIYGSDSGLVREVIVVGDSDGGIGGGDDHPSIQITFNPIYMQIERE